VASYHWLLVGNPLQCTKHAGSKRQPVLLQSSDWPPRWPVWCSKVALNGPARTASAVGVALACKGRLLPFVGAALLAVLWRAGEAPVLFAAVCCVLSASALGSRRGGAARGLEVRGPVLQLQVGGLGAGFAVEDMAQWRRGCDGPA